MSTENKSPTTRTPTRRVPGGREGGLLVAETKSMERKRRLEEQQGQRKFARVNQREHSADENSHMAPEGELQNDMLQHPELNSQRFDGIDPNLNPEPPSNPEAKREWENEKREQDKEKQYRLGNMPKFSSTPKPRGP